MFTNLESFSALHNLMNGKFMENTNSFKVTLNLPCCWEYFVYNRHHFDSNLLILLCKFTNKMKTNLDTKSILLMKMRFTVSMKMRFKSVEKIKTTRRIIELN